MPVLPPVIPLFPLGEVVLFPKVALPLHIFEPRYRKMAGDALAGDRIIGMTLFQAGFEAEYEGRPAVFPLGCAGRIEQSELLPDGRYNLLLRGESRFRILEERTDEPYRLGVIEELEDGRYDVARVSAARERILAAVSSASARPTLLVVQPDVGEELFLNTLCQMLPFDVVEKLSLLECDTLGERCDRLLELLEYKRLSAQSAGGRSERPN
jgi:uncharacterized protein